MWFDEGNLKLACIYFLIPLLFIEAGFSADQLSLDLIKTKCINFSEIKIGKSDIDVRECKVTEFGNIGEVEGQTYFYAIYCLLPQFSDKDSKCGDSSFDARYHSQRGLAIFSKRFGSKFASLIFERANPEIGTAVYEKPEFIDVGKEKVLLLPIRVDGTGVGNNSEYYLLRNHTWVQIDSESWQKSFREKLPAGLEVWKGIWPDLKTMKAQTGLYKKGDSNCCPSGGRANIDFGLQDTKLIVKKVTIEPPTAKKEP